MDLDDIINVKDERKERWTGRRMAKLAVREAPPVNVPLRDNNVSSPPSSSPTILSTTEGGRRRMTLIYVEEERALSKVLRNSVHYISDARLVLSSLILYWFPFSPISTHQAKCRSASFLASQWFLLCKWASTVRTAVERYRSPTSPENQLHHTRHQLESFQRDECGEGWQR